MTHSYLVPLVNQSDKRVTFHLRRNHERGSAAAPGAGFKLTVPPFGAVQVPAVAASDDWTVSAVVESKHPQGNTITTASHPIRPGAQFSLALDTEGAPVLRNDGAGQGLGDTPLLGQPGSWEAVGDQLQGSFAFPLQRQAQSQWCWAAVTSSVAAYFKNASPPSQKDLAVWAFGSTCALNPGSTKCDQPYDMFDSLSYTGNCSNYVNGEVNLDAVKAQVDAKSPLGLGIFWHDGSGGHAITITGYDTRVGSKPLIAVQDPGDPVGTVTICNFVDFPQHYSAGADWGLTFPTHARVASAPPANASNGSH